MKTFAQFLQEEHGRSARLARHLGISKTMVWRYKCGRLAIPSHLIRKIVEFSKGELTIDAFLPAA